MTKLLMVSMLVLVLGSPTRAEECKAPRHLLKPCEGTLLPPEAAFQSLQCLQYDKPLFELRLEHLQDIMNVKLAARDQVIEALKEHAVKQDTLLDKALSIKAPEQEWWEHPIFWTVVGIVVGAGSTIAIVYAVK